MKTIAAVVAGMTIAAAAPAAYACTCEKRPPPKEAFEAAVTVFEGEVIEREPVQPLGVAATFRVLRAWKGVTEGEVVVHTLADEGLCGLGFAKGQRWLVYTDNVENKSHTTLCSRSKQSASAAEDFAALGAPSYTPPQGCTGCSMNGHSSASWWWLGLLALGRRRNAV